MKYLWYYLLFINVLGLLSMLLDKYLAIKGLYRIPEKLLFGIAFLGGSVGSMLGMFGVRHKTQHWYFVIGMPLILVMHIGAYIFYRLVR